MAYCSLICTPDAFRPTDCSRVRWLDWENDYPLALAYWPQDPPLSQEDWEQNRTDGFRYCAIVEHEAIAALAAVWGIRRPIGKWPLSELLQLLGRWGMAKPWSAL